MHKLLCALPSPPLASFVRWYAERKIEVAGTDLIQPIPARLESTLEFQLGERFEVCHSDMGRFVTQLASIVGPQYKCSEIRMAKGVHSFAVFFTPTGLYRLFRLPMSDFTGTCFDAGDVIGTQRMQDLRGRLGEAHNFDERVAIVETFLFAKLPTLLCTRVLAAASAIFDVNGVIRMRDFASQQGFSERQMERSFLRGIGITPKLFSRVARFQTALDSKIAAPQRPWIEIAHHLGYHDQMHLVHDFRTLAGATPGKIHSAIGDGRPQALFGI